MTLKLSFLFSIFTVCSICSAQNSQAESLFNNAATFMAAGKYQDALKDYQSIVSQYADSGWADKALLEIGHFYRTIEKNNSQALAYYSKIKNSYAQSGSAPAAYYFSSLIRADFAKNRAELDDAGNDLVRMVGLYPENEWMANAFFLLGKINFRLGNLPLAQSFLQQLLLYYPQSDLIPQSFILRAKIAYYSGQKTLPLEILGRMQTYFPKNHEVYEESRQYGRLINRMTQTRITYKLDRNFPASTPKTYKNPKCINIDKHGLILIVDSNGFHFLTRETSTNPTRNHNLSIGPKSVVEIGVGPDGYLNIATETKILHLGETLTTAPVSIDELDSFGIDDFGRYYILEARQRDTLMYDRQGAFLRKLGVERMKKVRCRDQEVWILAPDGNNLVRYSADLKNLGTAASFERIKDFCFDALGNLYVVYNKGSRLAVVNRNGKKKAELDFKTGSYPLRSATAIAVDRSGAIYLVDGRGGAVYRFF